MTTTDELLEQIWHLPKADLLPIHPTMDQTELASNRYKPYQIERAHIGYVTSVAAGKNIVVSAAGDGKLRVWDKKAGKRIHELEGHSDIVRSVAVCGHYVVSARKIQH